MARRPYITEEYMDVDRAPPPEASGGNATGASLSSARQRYIGEMMNAIKGKPTAMFRKQYNSPQIAQVKSSMGSGLAAQYGTPSQPAMDPARKAYSDMVAASNFMYPDTDPLAYSRRIEHPQVFSHDGQFGF